VEPKPFYDPRDFASSGCLFTLSTIDGDSNWYGIKANTTSMQLGCLGGGSSGHAGPPGSLVIGDSGVIIVQTNINKSLLFQHGFHWKFLRRKDGQGMTGKDFLVLINRKYPLALIWRTGDVGPSCGGPAAGVLDNQ